MQQLLKSIHPFNWMMSALAATMLLCACGSAETKTDGNSTDTMSVKPAPADSGMNSKMSPADSLPQLDDSAGGRPDGVQTNQ